MDARRSRAELVPNANNPRLLLRLVGFVATGVRRPAALAEVLEVELRTVHYYTQAAEWLGLMDGGADLRLTARGLALAYADPDSQRALYAEAVWANPLAAAVLGAAVVDGEGELPATELIAQIISSREPGMSLSTARRRASAVRGLVTPAVDRKPDSRKARGDQLGLPFPVIAPPKVAAMVDLRAGTEESPDIYRRVLVALLDHGELSTGQLRALLDGMGAKDAPLGSYVDMATRRGDAVRIDERLVATRGAARRREVVEDSVLVALTDPIYREYLDLLERAVGALQRTSDGKATADDGRIRSRLSALARRFAAWDLRIFGRRLQPGEVEEAMSGLLLGRRLQGMPVAGDGGEPLPLQQGPFVDAVVEGPVALAFPRALLQLRGGVSEVNRLLKRDRSAPAGVRVPGPVDRRGRVHGGLLAPQEAPPRAVPDNLSLRLRALSHVPALSLLGALLLAGRRGAGRPLVRTGASRDAPMVELRGATLGTVLDVLGRFADDQGWVLLRPACDGLTNAELAEVAEDLGIATRASGLLLLDEALFLRLQEDPECHLVYEALLPLEDRLMGWLAGP